MANRAAILRHTWIILTSLVALILVAVGTTWFRPSSARKVNSEVFRSLEWRSVDDLALPLAQYNSVFWEPLDTESLRQRIFEAGALDGKSVLEIGTGTGLIAICCLLAGAQHVIATDVNALAIANARHNAERFGVSERLDARLVPLSRSTAFSVIDSTERFDLIVSNPPWENDQPRHIAEYALYDPGFRLLRSLLEEGHSHLKPGGRMWLAYGCVEAIRIIEEVAPQHGWHVQRLDDRNLDELPPVFLPGFLLELTPG